MRIFRAKAALKGAWLVLIGSLIAYGLSAVLPAQAPLPRASLAGFKYLGAFKAPFGEYGACKIAWNPGGNGGQGSLYLTGGGTDSFSIGEIGIPALLNTRNRDDLDLLNMAQVLQAPADIYSRIPQKAASWPVGDVNLYDGGNYAVFGGLFYEAGKLYFNASTYYDGEGAETATTGRIENPSDLAHSAVVGMFHNQGAAHTSGWMMSVPAEWQARLGGTHLTGNDNGIPILSRLSAGPSLFAFNLATVASAAGSAVIPTVTRLDFPDVSGARSIWGDGMANLSGGNKTWTLMTDAGIGLIVPGTRSYVLLGTAGGFNPNPANPWQGTAEAAFSPPYAGTIAYKRMDSSGYTAGGPMVWDAQDRHYLATFFDLEEILSAEHPWTPRPYSTCIFPAPFGRYGDYAIPGQMPDSIEGGAWDPVSKRLYLTLPAADNANDPEYPGNPVIAVYELLPPGDTDDFLATFDGQGVYYRSSDSGGWTNLATPADLVACGDLSGDGVDDLIGIWSGQAGVWVRSSADGQWGYLGSSPRHIAAGDMNGDGRADLLGTWDGQGVFYRDSIAGTWFQMATPASLVTTGDLDGDNRSDLIGIWPGQAGAWVKYSSTGIWSYLGSSPRDFAAGDMNGDGRADLVGTWDGQGVFYRDSMTGNWTMMATPADQVAAGDLDGDGTDDLIGIWAGQAGVWANYSATGYWAYIGSSARDIAAGRMRKGIWGSGLSKPMPPANAPVGMAEGPSRNSKYVDLSSEGPGGSRFSFKRGVDLVPRMGPAEKTRLPGPGEAGFRFVQQKNLFPGSTYRGG